MSSWHNLPCVFKRHVVDKLDLRSRCSLRQCSKPDLELVDGCPVFLKRLDITFANGLTFKIQEFSGSSFSLKNVLDLKKLLQNPGSKIDDVRIFGRDDQKVKNFITELSACPDFKFPAKNLYWRCHGSEDFIIFLEFFNQLEMIHNNMDSFEPEQMERLGKMSQWETAKEVFLENGQVESVEPFLSCRNCTVYFKKLDGDDVWKMIQSFISRDHPLGSSFDLYHEQPPKLQDVFKANGVVPKHEPIIPHDIGVHGRHTQRLKMAVKGNFLVVKNTEMGIRGKVEKIEE